MAKSILMGKGLDVVDVVIIAHAHS